MEEKYKSRRARLRVVSENVSLAEVNDRLVRRHHDRRVWNLADELREEAAI